MEISKLEVHSCHKCFAIFTTQKELDEHLYYHEILPTELLDHFLSVTVSLERINEYKCNNCSRLFPTERELRLHEVKHMKDMVMSNRSKKLDEAYEKAEKPYKCEVCGICYVAESTLQMHSVIHEPFPHVCHCGIGYYITADFNNHRKLVHSEAPLPLEQISREDNEKPTPTRNKRNNTIKNGQVCKPDNQVEKRKVKKELKVETQKSENKYLRKHRYGDARRRASPFNTYGARVPCVTEPPYQPASR
ncbi:hypothetical protein K1T71_006995 [Dendrolimus kikuchii]|uniref:Uncharacterized protein n=1 Tax=Dendrolimus kikuchii TaxID=765133 RepID=A0ACC1CZ58_9NEOP|nr:hypothetical protein K1T71_006995 [Dendrolimus kikuchii]